MSDDIIVIEVLEKQCTEKLTPLIVGERPILNDQQFEAEIAAMGENKELRAKWLHYWEPLRDDAYKSYTNIMKKIKQLGDPLRDRIEWHNKRCKEYEMERRRRIAQMEADLNLQAKKRAEDAALAQAQMYQDAGRPDVADQIISAPVPVAPIVVSQRPNVPRASIKTQWKARIVDLEALIKARAEKVPGVPPDALVVNMKPLNELAGALKGEMRVPGVEAYEEPIFQNRGQ